MRTIARAEFRRAKVGRPCARPELRMASHPSVATHAKVVHHTCGSALLRTWPGRILTGQGRFLFQDHKSRLSIAVQRPAHEVIQYLGQVRLAVGCLERVITLIEDYISEGTIRLLANRLERK